MPVEISVKLNGFAQLTGVMEKLATNGLFLMGRALYQEAEDIMTTSKDGWVPVDLGALKGTGHVELPVIEGRTISVVMGYGGPAAPYAAVQHEGVRNFTDKAGVVRQTAHFSHPGVGRDKYLEGPVLEAVPSMGARLAARWGIELEGLLG